MAFRYVVPKQPSIDQVLITGERTQFRYSKDATLYPLVVNGFQSSYEDDYQMRTVSGLHPDWLVALPLLAEVPGTGWVAITEANIDNYAGMYLRSDKPLHHPQGRAIAKRGRARTLPSKPRLRSRLRGAC